MNYKLIITALIIVTACSTTQKKPKENSVEFFPNQFSPDKDLSFSLTALLQKELLIERFGSEYGIRDTNYLSKDQELKFRKEITTEAIFNSFVLVNRIIDAVENAPTSFAISDTFECEEPKDQLSKVLHLMFCKKGSRTRDQEETWKIMTSLKKENFELEKKGTEENNFVYSTLTFNNKNNSFFFNLGKIDGRDRVISYNTELTKTISLWPPAEFSFTAWPFATYENKPVLINYDLAYFISSHLPIINLQQCQKISASLIERGKELMIHDLIENSDPLEPFKDSNFCNNIFGWREDQKNEIDKNLVLNFINLKYLWKIILMNYVELNPIKKKINNEDAIIINIKIDFPKLTKEIKIMKRTDYIKMK